MAYKEITQEDLLHENEELRLRLSEAEEALNAIRGGEVDAIVVSGSEGDKVFSLTSAETPYRILLEEMDEGALTVNSDGLINYCNNRFASLISQPIEKIIGTNCRNFIADSEKSRFDKLLRKGQKGRAHEVISFTRNGSDSNLHLKLSVRELPSNISGDICIVASDVSELKVQKDKLDILVQKRTKEIQLANERLKKDIIGIKRSEEELVRLNRTLNAHSESSQAMMRIRNEQEYLNEVCKIIVEDCGHSMVWIGYAQNDKRKSVKPVAHFGFDKGYIDQMNITWDESPNGTGPTGTAIRTGKPSVCRNMLTDPCFAPWREAAIKRGYASSIVLPLKSDGKTFGAVSIYSKDPDPFSVAEINLLTDLADDLSYGIQFTRLSEYEKDAARAIKENEVRLKELIATKDKFFNIIAHDLKNPFTSLLGASELLYDNIDQMTADKVKKLSLIMNESAKSGYAILQNLLDWSRSQTGMLKFNPELFNLKNIIVENIDNLQLQIRNKEITVDSDLMEDHFITADKNMINTVLRNLLSNAVKYTYKNGAITVNVLHNKNEITLSVKDTGIGITKEKIDDLFQLDNSLSLPGTEKEQGTGLGLKLCKEFTEKMGGRICVESEIGKGTEFKFSIPLF